MWAAAKGEGTDRRRQYSRALSSRRRHRAVSAAAAPPAPPGGRPPRRPTPRWQGSRHSDPWPSARPPSRRRDCHCAAPPFTFIRCFNTDKRGVSSKCQSRRRLRPPPSAPSATSAPASALHRPHRRAKGFWAGAVHPFWEHFGGPSNAPEGISSSAIRRLECCHASRALASFAPATPCRGRYKAVGGPHTPPTQACCAHAHDRSMCCRLAPTPGGRGRPGPPGCTAAAGSRGRCRCSCTADRYRVRWTMVCGGLTRSNSIKLVAGPEWRERVRMEGGPGARPREPLVPVVVDEPGRRGGSQRGLDCSGRMSTRRLAAASEPAAAVDAGRWRKAVGAPAAGGAVSRRSTSRNRLPAQCPIRSGRTAQPSRPSRILRSDSSRSRLTTTSGGIESPSTRRVHLPAQPRPSHVSVLSPLYRALLLGRAHHLSRSSPSWRSELHRRRTAVW